MRNDQRRLVGPPDLLAKVRHENLDVIVSGVGIAAIGAVHQNRLGKRLAGTKREDMEDLVLGRGEVNRVPAALHFTADGVDSEPYRDRGTILKPCGNYTLIMGQPG